MLKPTRVLMACICLLPALAGNAGITRTAPPPESDSIAAERLPERATMPVTMSGAASPRSISSSGSSRSNSNIYDSSSALTIKRGDYFYKVTRGYENYIKIDGGPAEQLQTWGKHSMAAKKSEAPLGVSYRSSSYYWNEPDRITVSFTLKNKTRNDMTVSFAEIHRKIVTGQSEYGTAAHTEELSLEGETRKAIGFTDTEAKNSIKLNFSDPVKQTGQIAPTSYIYGDPFPKTEDGIFSLFYYNDNDAIFDPAKYPKENWMTEGVTANIELCAGIIWQDIVVPAKKKVTLSYDIRVNTDFDGVDLIANDFKVASRDIANWNDASKPHPVTVTGTYTHPSVKKGRIYVNFTDDRYSYPEWKPLTGLLNPGDSFSAEFTIPGRESLGDYYTVRYRVHDEDGDVYDIVPTEIPTVHAVANSAVWQTYGKLEDGSYGYTYYSPLYDGTQHTLTELPKSTFTTDQYILSDFGENIMPGSSGGSYAITGVYPSTIGSAKKWFPIRGLPLPGSIELAQDDYEWNEGISVTPDWKFTDPEGMAALQEGVDYDLYVPTATKPGAYSVSARGKGRYANSNNLYGTFYLRTDLPAGAIQYDVPTGNVILNKYGSTYVTLSASGVDLEDEGGDDFSDAFDIDFYICYTDEDGNEKQRYVSNGDTFWIPGQGTYTIKARINWEYNYFYDTSIYRIPEDEDGLVTVGTFTAATPLPLAYEEFRILQMIRYDLIENHAWANPWPEDFTAENCYSLRGVTLTKNDGEQYAHVSRIDLQGENLIGLFPVSLLQLPSLQYINLSRNYLSGRIEDAVTGIEAMPGAQSLKEINISNNWLQGNIGALISRLPALDYINAFANSLTEYSPVHEGLRTNLYVQRIPYMSSTDIHLSEFYGSWIADNIPPIVIDTGVEEIDFCFNESGKFHCIYPMTGYIPEHGIHVFDEPSGAEFTISIGGKRSSVVFAGQQETPLRLFWDMGDANMDGYFNVTDLPHLIDYCLNGMENKLQVINMAASDMYADTRADGESRLINVQDVVRMVDGLIAAPVADSRSRGDSPAEASVYIAGSEIILDTPRDISAILVRTSKGVEWNLAALGLEASLSPDGRSIVGYSMNGRHIAAGRTVIGRVTDSAVAVVEAQLADTDLRTVTTSAGEPHTTGVVIPSCDSDSHPAAMYDLTGRRLQPGAKGFRIVIDGNGRVSKQVK